MDLGVFSVSPAVKDLAASRAFYEKLGFSVCAGDASQNWLILQNWQNRQDRQSGQESQVTTIGLFQGMFDRNILTFNPGWTSKQERLKQFMDVRELQRLLKQRGLELQSEADESTTGPAHLVLLDPDGNPILLDQHV